MKSLLTFLTFLFVVGIFTQRADADRQERSLFLNGELGETLRDLFRPRRGDLFDSAFGTRRDVPITKREEFRETEAETDIDDEDEPPPDVVVERPHQIDEMPAFHPLIIPFSFPFGLLQPWWRGPNVCTERTEVDEEGKGMKTPFGISIHSTQCIPGDTTYICTRKIRNENVSKTITIKHHCCHGFARRKDGKPGCEKVNMYDLLQTIKDLGATEFDDMLESTTLAQKMSSENFTVFAPSNDALEDMEQDDDINSVDDNQSTRKKDKGYSDLTTGHVVEGFVSLDMSQNDQVLTSLNGKTTVRINKYGRSRGVVTANCVPVASKDNFAINGIVHLVSEVLPQPRKSIIDIVKASPDYSIFSKLLMESDLKEELRNSEKSWTMFVPSDVAFKKMDKTMMLKLMSGEGCSESIVRNHVLQGTVCKQAIENVASIQNYLGKSMTLIALENNQLKVNGYDVSVTNVLGTNGVIHFIDDVLVPEEAYSLLEYLEKSDRKDLLDLISAADLTEELENLHNITFFAPSKDALKKIPNDTFQEWMSEPEKLREILKYHLAAPKTMLSEMSNNKSMMSLDNGLDIRIRLSGMFPGLILSATAQCSSMVKPNDAVCGGVIHTVDKLMVPPKPSILEALKGMDNHNILLKVLADTELESKLSNPLEGPYTFLAPTDSAFERLDNSSLDDLLINKEKAEQVLRNHLIDEPMCCRGDSNFPFGHQFVRTMEGNMLTLYRSGHLGVKFGPARAVKCDITARNGIMHSVSRVILPNRRPLRPLFDFDLFNIF